MGNNHITAVAFLIDTHFTCGGAAGLSFIFGVEMEEFHP